MNRIFSFLLALGIFTSFSPQLLAQNTATDICPILVGTQIPDAQLNDQNGEAVSVHQLIEKQPTILIVYRGAWCPYCNKHLSAMVDLEDELVEMGYQILAVSPDKPSELEATFDKHEPKYKLYSDSKMAFSDALGLSFQVDEKTIKKYKLWGIDLGKSSGGTHQRLPVPALMIIDKNGMLKFSFVNPNYKVRAEPELIRAAAKASLK